MIKKICLIIIISMIIMVKVCFCADTQKDSIVDRYRLGITHLAIVNNYMTIQANQQYNLTHRWYLGLETGYIIGRILRRYNDVDGYRIRPSLGYNFRIRERRISSLQLFFNYRSTYMDYTFKDLSMDPSSPITIDQTRHNLLYGGGILIDLTTVHKSYHDKLGIGFAGFVVKNRYENPNYVDFSSGPFGFGFPTGQDFGMPSIFLYWNYSMSPKRYFSSKDQ